MREKTVSVLRCGFKKWDRFAFFLSLYGALAFSITTLIPTIVDPLLHNPIYGTRTYPLGNWVVLFSGIVFIFLYRSNVMEKDILKFGGDYLAPNRCVFSSLSILIPMAMVLVNFLPELPHMWVFDNAILYAAIVAFAAFMHNYSPDYAFATDHDIHPEARIELIKTTYNSYYIALALMATLGVGAATMNPSPLTYVALNEQIILSMASRINLYFKMLGLLCGLAWQVFVGMYRAQQKLLQIKKSFHDSVHKIEGSAR